MLKQEIIEKIKANKRCKKELFVVNNVFESKTIDNWLQRNDVRLCTNFNLEIIAKWLNLPIEYLTDIDVLQTV